LGAVPGRIGEAMTKQEQFLWAVQTTLLANSIYLTTKPKQIEGKGHIISATGMSNSIRAALAASDRIPADLSAFEAAMEFCGWMMENWREADSKMPLWIYGC
jgi:hypothetical protein